MLKNIVPRDRKTLVYYELAFDDGHNNGYAFPCDADGNVNMENLQEAAIKNLAWCKEHPEKFVRFNKVIVIRQTYTEPAHGTCSCGEQVMLENQWYGACQCPNCDRWYNLFGESILPPGQWEEDMEEDW